MPLAEPDPTRMVPLPLREQAAVRDRWLSQRLLDLLPVLMDRTGIDLWIVAGRECNEDPVLATLLPGAWLSARRRTVLLLHRSDDGVTPVAVSRYPVGQFLPATAEDAAGPVG
ncbi:MAG: Xaa-Pro aminopeptidase, partial [Blastococcus sp.]|nr:Xaa-Pro aminopeptidase [Blastococcus sp.]